MGSVPGQGSSACCTMQPKEEEVIPEEDKIYFKRLPGWHDGSYHEAGSCIRQN